MHLWHFFETVHAIKRELDQPPSTDMNQSLSGQQRHKDETSDFKYMNFSIFNSHMYINELVISD